jgi:hypothetical protein
LSYYFVAAINGLPVFFKKKVVSKVTIVKILLQVAKKFEVLIWIAGISFLLLTLLRSFPKERSYNNDESPKEFGVSEPLVVKV